MKVYSSESSVDAGGLSKYMAQKRKERRIRNSITAEGGGSDGRTGGRARRWCRDLVLFAQMTAQRTDQRGAPRSPCSSWTLWTSLTCENKVGKRRSARQTAESWTSTCLDANPLQLASRLVRQQRNTNGRERHRHSPWDKRLMWPCHG